MCFVLAVHVTEVAEACFDSLSLPGQTIVMCISELYSDTSKKKYKARK